MSQTNVVVDGINIAVWESDFADDNEKFHAINMTECVKYGFCKAVDSDMFEMMAEYCRLVDECGLVEFGSTIDDAVKKLTNNKGGINNVESKA